MSKNNKRTTQKRKRLAEKIKGDGKAIASVETAVHNLKGTLHESNSNGNRGYSNLPRLLGSVQEQETAWLLAVTDCRNHAARIPTSQVTGAIPVDLWRVTEVATAVASANNDAYVMTMADSYVTTAAGTDGLLHANGASSCYGAVTQHSYAVASFPTSGAPAVGVTLPLIGDVSADFVSNAASGTEYIMVANKTTVRCSQVANAAADAAYSGRVRAFFTLDAERHTLVGHTADVLEEEALMQDSPVFMREYLITRDGLFVPVGEDGAEPLSEISTVSLPLSVDAYEWRRIGAEAIDSTNVNGRCNVGFYIQAPENTQFEVETTYLWQTERYASHKVVANDPGHQEGAAYIQGNMGGYLGSGMTYEQFHGSAMLDTRLLPSGKLKNTPAPPQKPIRNASHDGPVPGAAMNLGQAVAPYPGKPIAPHIAPMAVIGNAMLKPGVHLQMVREAQGNGNPVRNIANPEIAKFALRNGPESAKKAHSRWNWKNILKGAWDIAKVIGPAVMALL